MTTSSRTPLPFFFYGVAYYPEHWDPSRWETDLRLMREAGVNMVRLGEFAWSVFERAEGQYDFSLYDDFLSCLATYDIRAMLCTCSRTPPPWVFAAYPEIANVDRRGRRNMHGSRYTVSLHHPTFIDLSRRIDGAVIEHFADHPSVVAWQIDNEIGCGNEDFSDAAHAAFCAHLREKYGDVETLNRNWGSHFWSFALTDFSQAPLPAGEAWGVADNPALTLEWRRFNSKIHVEFARWRRDRIKDLAPKAVVTTNFQLSHALHTNIFDLGTLLDIPGTNYYPPAAKEFGLDYCRGPQGDLLVLEQRTGQPMWEQTTRPGYMRLWAVLAVAHGVKGLIFFRWRTARYGQEQYWHGILQHAGKPNRRYAELQRLGSEVARWGRELLAARRTAPVALVVDYDSRWALGAVLTNKAVELEKEAYAFHEALMARNVGVDACGLDRDLSRYALVIAPRMYCVDEARASLLREYVAAGGTLCLTFRSAVADEFNVIHADEQPALLTDLCGVAVREYGALCGPVALELGQDYEGYTMPEATLWADELELRGAEPVATYATGWLRGLPAVTVHRYGKGRVVYCASALRGPGMDGLLRLLLDLSGACPVLDTTDGVQALELRDGPRIFLFLLNHGFPAKDMDLPGVWCNLANDDIVSRVTVNPLDYVLLYREEDS